MDWNLEFLPMFQGNLKLLCTWKGTTEDYNIVTWKVTNQPEMILLIDNTNPAPPEMYKVHCKYCK